MCSKKTELISKLAIVLSLIFFNSLVALASEYKMQSYDQHEVDPVDTPEEISEYIQHHVKDSHDFHLFSYFSGGEEHHVGFPLPVILLGEDGFTAFMSSEFRHDNEGKVIVNKRGSNFTKLHGKIYELDKGATELVFDKDHHTTNASTPFDLSITKLKNNK